MELHTLWNITAIAHAAMAMAALTMAWSFARRVQLGGRAILLLLCLFTLTAFFGTAGWDAMLHAKQPDLRSLTSWTLAAHVLQVLAVVFALTFYGLAIETLIKPAADSGEIGVRYLGHSTTAAGYVFLALLLFRLHRANWNPNWLAKGDESLPIQIGVILLVAIATVRKYLPSAQGGSWLPAPQAGPSLTRLNLSNQENSRAPITIAVDAADLQALASAIAPFALTFVAQLLLPKGWNGWTIPTYALLQLAMLPSIAGLIYYQTRATFFDILLKRGVVLGILCLVAIAAAPLVGAAVAVFGMAFAYTAILLHEALDSWLDRTVFGRPDYRLRLTEITAAVAKQSGSDPSALVTQELAETLRADWVRFGESPDPASVLVIAVESPSQHWGILSFGPRRRGAPYQSADVAFLSGVAAQLGAAFEGRQAEAELRLAAEAEVRALRAQINPHFLFNSLNSLADMVKDSPDAERTVLDLARVFRHSLDAMRAPSVTVGEEVQFLESYLAIEKIRFEQRLQYKIDCSEELKTLPIPPMLIQPLIENSLKHGLTPKIEGGSVKVTVSRNGSRLRIAVEDDGIGFPSSAVRAGAVGVDNVRKRVEALPAGRFAIQSEPGRGSTVVLEWEVA